MPAKSPASTTSNSVTRSSRRIGRSVLAIVAGFLTTFALSYGIDAVLVGAGALPNDGSLPLYGSTLLIALVLAYRTIFNIVGSAIAGLVAPRKPMTHALILGALGAAGGAAGAVAMSDAAPAWYSWGLVALSLPAAWLGGRFATQRRGASIG